MPLRNPFKKTTETVPGARPVLGEDGHPVRPDGFEEAQVVGSKPITAQNVKGIREDPNEYKLSGELTFIKVKRWHPSAVESVYEARIQSFPQADTTLIAVVNDSGVYLPPSPPEKKGFWHRSHPSSASSSHRSTLNENEQFSISRESFDSYRRSFDISARSPVIQPETPPRRSLDSRQARLPRSAIGNRKFDREPPTEEEAFEDVGLNDEVKPKKKGIFSRFGESTEAGVGSAHHGFHITGRKRGQSGQGAELGRIERPSSSAGGQGEQGES